MAHAHHSSFSLCHSTSSRSCTLLQEVRAFIAKLVVIVKPAVAKTAFIIPAKRAVSASRCCIASRPSRIGATLACQAEVRAQKEAHQALNLCAQECLSALMHTAFTGRHALAGIVCKALE